VLARIVERHVVDHQALLRSGRHYMRWGQPAAVAGAKEAVRARAHALLELLEAELQVLLLHHARRARERPRGAIEPVELHSVLNPRHHLTRYPHLPPEASCSAHAGGIKDTDWGGDQRVSSAWKERHPGRRAGKVAALPAREVW